MSNSDYLIGATVKKISERINKTFVEKIEEVTNIAQEAPEIFKNEIDNLKEEILKEAQRLENSEKDNSEKDNSDSEDSNLSKDLKIAQILEKIDSINIHLKNLNNLLDEKS